MKTIIALAKYASASRLATTVLVLYGVALTSEVIAGYII